MGDKILEYNKVNVKICGKEYSLQTKENPSYFRDIAERLDKRIKSLMEENSNLSMSSASVLVGLSLMEDKVKTFEEIKSVLERLDETEKELKSTLEKLK